MDSESQVYSHSNNSRKRGVYKWVKGGQLYSQTTGIEKDTDSQLLEGSTGRLQPAASDGDTQPED